MSWTIEAVHSTWVRPKNPGEFIDYLLRLFDQRKRHIGETDSSQIELQRSQRLQKRIALEEIFAQATKGANRLVGTVSDLHDDLTIDVRRHAGVLEVRFSATQNGGERVGMTWPFSTHYEPGPSRHSLRRIVGKISRKKPLVSIRSHQSKENFGDFPDNFGVTATLVTPSGREMKSCVFSDTDFIDAAEENVLARLPCRQSEARRKEAVALISELIRQQWTWEVGQFRLYYAPTNAQSGREWIAQKKLSIFAHKSWLISERHGKRRPVLWSSLKDDFDHYPLEWCRLLSSDNNLLDNRVYLSLPTSRIGSASKPALRGEHDAVASFLGAISQQDGQTSNFYFLHVMAEGVRGALAEFSIVFSGDGRLYLAEAVMSDPTQ